MRQTFRLAVGGRLAFGSLGALLPPGTTAESVVLSDEHDAVVLVSFEEAVSRIRFPVNAEELRALEAALRS